MFSGGNVQPWPQRVGNTLGHFALQRLESKVFRFALLTVLLVAAVQQFVGWKYSGVVIREIVARVQQQVLPWGAPEQSQRWLVAPTHKVAALLIGDELFALKDGFGHAVPLPPDRVLRLLSEVLSNVPPQARLVVDFDLAPRVGEAPEPRRALDDWLAAHAHRLLLVEPSWAARHAPTLERQLAWAWRMCRIEPGPTPDPAAGDPPGAVFVQSTLTSHFGYVVDTLPLSGKHGPAWDIGRAVANRIDPGERRRNPICSRLRGDSSGPDATDPVTLQLLLARELQQHGALRIAAQPADPTGRDAHMLLRSEFIRADAGCRPANFEDIAGLACLPGADVVVIGGAWSYGLGDIQDTFVGEADGAVVHAAWIQSWLKPARHLNKALDVLLDVLIIESLLHPILEHAFVGMRRRSDLYGRRLKLAAPHSGLGLHVAAMLGYLLLAALAFIGTAFALMVIDGLLRWAFDRSMALDTTILALVLWSVIAINGVGSQSPAQARLHHAPFPRANVAWLVGLCVGSLAISSAAFGLSSSHPAAVPWLVWLAAAGLLAGFVAHAAVRQWRAAHTHHPVEPQTLGARWNAFCTRQRVLWGSVWQSLQGLCPWCSGPRRGWRARLGDGVGAILWMGLWGLGLWVLAGSTLWGLLLEWLKG